MVNTGTRLREERERLGMNQDDFAATGGVGKRALIHYEKNERSPDTTFLSAVAAAGVDVLYVITGQRSQPVAEVALLPEGDRILLDNFHAAPTQVQAGVRTTLGAFADAPRQVKGRKKAV
jgi:transcriptional regulator with XRE-family HTH domain